MHGERLTHGASMYKHQRSNRIGRCGEKASDYLQRQNAYINSRNTNGSFSPPPPRIFANISQTTAIFICLTAGHTYKDYTEHCSVWSYQFYMYYYRQYYGAARMTVYADEKGRFLNLDF